MKKQKKDILFVEITTASCIVCVEFLQMHFISFFPISLTLYMCLFTVIYPDFVDKFSDAEHRFTCNHIYSAAIAIWC